MRIGRPEAFSLIAGSDAPLDSSQLYGTRAWQVLGWDSYDRVPEHHSTTAFIAACLSRLRFRLMWLGDDDEPGPVWDEDGKVREDINPAMAEVGRQLVRTLRARRGGQAALLSKIGANLAQAGDLYAVPRERNGRRYFDAFSIDELRPQSDGTYIRYAGPGRPAETFARTDDGKLPLVIRVYKEHPRFSAWADSPTRSLLPTLEVMDLLTQEMRSSTVSRIMGPGIVLISEDADLPPDPDNPDREGLTRIVTDVAATAIRDKSSAAAHVPIFVTVPHEVVKDGTKQLTFSQGDLNTIPKRDAAVSTYARGAELPVEQVVGMSNANHWGAWMIDETTSKIYIAPIMEIVDAILTDDYLWPSLAMAAGVAPDSALPPDVAGFVIGYDDSELVIHPNQGAAADVGYGTARQPNFAVSHQAWRSVHGFPESDAPDDEEIEERMAWAERLNARVSVGGPFDDGTGLPDEQDPGKVQPGPPPAPSASQNGQNGSGPAPAAALLRERISAAVEVAAERAVDRLGARLRSAANAKMAAAEVEFLRGVPSFEIPRRLGPTTTETLIPPAQQFVGEFAALERTVSKWTADLPNTADIAREAVRAAEELARSLCTPGSDLGPPRLDSLAV